ncbi:endoplasmic reticulum-based factor for assembly of V-ATPase-domain-containing protein [Aspergillus pseudotamarii]|uniref:Endoplasmic reticulum-based factor for assembly of V-ATPase-domain-containing protein n=1 Tax=Aspergillus pseudotamarii TaxID=132259 RepID=A0A5N6TD28_ASPPS|nr:endoplasmic reticulum-based factor for assembly of V-ATPase-domain-containing protein [Aspergillus pseudotamarii]KAE8144041.1 endoplasmic reticulum-based factor for assembly of V-ATPase-domain-containing protein [Aspergillus pseudotamarii]
MVQLITTTRILSALEAIPTSDRKDLDLPSNPSLDSPITHDQLIRLSRYFRAENATSNAETRSLNSLLHGTKVYVPPPPPKPEPSPEYLALKARLLAAYETDTYNQMTASSNTTNGPSPIFTSSTPTVSALHEDDAHSDADTLTPGLVLNIFLSVVITGFSVYWALTSFSTPELLTEAVSSVWDQNHGSKRGGGVSEAVKVLVSFGAAVGVGVAEVAIYAIYLGKVERARKKERGVKERKVVVGREVLGRRDESESVQRVDGEKEEIWGRGPNGGLRRRVRERWEEKEKEGDGDGD